jgi:hypothetical protein
MAERKSTKGQKTRVRCLTPLSTIVHCITYFDNDVTNTYHFLRGFQFSTIPPISAKRTITSHLNSLNTKKTTTCDVITACKEDISLFSFFVSGVIPPRVTQHVPKVATVDTEYAIAIKSKY